MQHYLATLFNFLSFPLEAGKHCMARFLSLKSYLAKWNLPSPHCSSTKYNVIFKISKFESESGYCIMCLRFFKFFIAVVSLRLNIMHFTKLIYLAQIFSLFSNCNISPNSQVRFSNTISDFT